MSNLDDLKIEKIYRKISLNFASIMDHSEEEIQSVCAHARGPHSRLILSHGGKQIRDHPQITSAPQGGDLGRRGYPIRR